MGEMQYKIFPPFYKLLEVTKKNRKKRLEVLLLTKKVQPQQNLCKIINPMVMGKNCN